MKEKKDDLDWDSRTLCSDESCIGVIGPDGRCKECGKAYEDRPSAEDPDAGAADEPVDAYEGDTEDAEEDTETITDIDWERRTLCSDESCIGVIGPDGRCKECGKKFENG
jgi:hypothetical protein